MYSNIHLETDTFFPNFLSTKEQKWRQKYHFSLNLATML